MSIYTAKEIAERVRPVAEEYGVASIYLFGSYARGDANEDSDIDLYVELARPLGLKYCSFFADIEKSVGKNIDIITKDGLYNPATLKANEPLIRKIGEEGQCIYEHKGH